MIKEYVIETRSHAEMRVVDREIRQALAESGVAEGVVHLFVPHTTAALTINENADPDVVRDMVMETGKMVPWNDGYRHAEGNSAAHVKSSLFGPSLTLLVTGGRVVLGTWQSVYFCEFDGPRTRRLLVKVVAC